MAESREIPLTQGKIAIVDADDFDCISQHKWYAWKSCNVWYARRTVRYSDDSQYGQPMHRLIMGFLGKHTGPIIDHIDHNGLNNQKDNLRIVTPQQNLFNRLSAQNASSQYKGVSWHIHRNKWQVSIKHNGNRYHLGSFESEIEAARAYDEKAVELFGEYAYLNCSMEAIVE